MNNEIKEILDKLKDIHNFDYSEECDSYNNLIKKEYDIYLSKKETDLLLDCMTNLQQRCEYLERSNNRREDTIIGLRFEVAEQEDYKSRCEKASECIKKDTRWFDSEYARVYGKLCDCAGAKGDRLEVMVNPSNALNILQNGSDSQ